MQTTTEEQEIDAQLVTLYHLSLNILSQILLQCRNHEQKYFREKPLDIETSLITKITQILHGEISLNALTDTEISQLAITLTSQLKNAQHKPIADLESTSLFGDKYLISQKHENTIVCKQILDSILAILNEIIEGAVVCEIAGTLINQGSYKDTQGLVISSIIATFIAGIRAVHDIYASISTGNLQKRNFAKKINCIRSLAQNTASETIPNLETHLDYNKPGISKFIESIFVFGIAGAGLEADPFQAFSFLQDTIGNWSAAEIAFAAGISLAVINLLLRALAQHSEGQSNKLEAIISNILALHRISTLQREILPSLPTNYSFTSEYIFNLIPPSKTFSSFHLQLPGQTACATSALIRGTLSAAASAALVLSFFISESSTNYNSSSVEFAKEDPANSNFCRLIITIPISTFIGILIACLSFRGDYNNVLKIDRIAISEAQYFNKLKLKDKNIRSLDFAIASTNERTGWQLCKIISNVITDAKTFDVLLTVVVLLASPLPLGISSWPTWGRVLLGGTVGSILGTINYGCGFFSWRKSKQHYNLAINNTRNPIEQTVTEQALAPKTWRNSLFSFIGFRQQERTFSTQQMHTNPSIQ